MLSAVATTEGLRQEDEELFQLVDDGRSLDNIRTVLQSGANPCAKVLCGHTILGRSVQLNRWDVILSLVQAVAPFQNRFPRLPCNVNAKDSYQRTALHYAAETGHTEIISLLLGAGCKLDVGDHEKVTPLHLAASQGKKDALICLLKFGSNPNLKTASCYEKVTPLHIAAGRGLTEIVECLLAGGARVDPQDYKDQTPLYLAVSRAHYPVVAILLAHGADPDICQVNGYNCLAEAVSMGDEEMVRFLLSKGAKSPPAVHLLHQAILSSSASVALALVCGGADVEQRDSHGWTSLHLSCRASQIPVVEALLIQGADSNAIHAPSGETPVFCAVRSAVDENFDSILSLLWRFGADLDFRKSVVGNVAPATPLSLALSLDKVEQAKALLELGSEPNLAAHGIQRRLPELFDAFGSPLLDFLFASGFRFSVIPADSFSEVDPRFLSCFHRLRRLPLSLQAFARLRLRHLLLGLRPLDLRLSLDSLPIPDNLKFYMEFLVL